MQTSIKTCNNSSFTSLELIIVIIMIGIMAAVAIPAMHKLIERTRGERTIANIELTKDAYRAYIIRYPNFSGNPLDLAEINNLFHLELTDPWFNYNPVTVSNTSLSLTTTRTGSGEVITYSYYLSDDNSTWGGNWPWLP